MSRKSGNNDTAKLSDALVWVKNAMEKYQNAVAGDSQEDRAAAAENLKMSALASQTVVNACNVIARVCQVTGSKDEAKHILGDL